MKTPLVYAFALSVIGGLALATPAFADDPSGKHSPMKTMDANGDGKVTATEHAAGAEKMFEKMDADGDGKVTATEMDASHKSKDMSSARTSKPMKSSADKIKAMDQDNDGALSVREHEAGASEMFGKMDSDKDGSLTAEEIRAGHEKMMTAEDH